MENNFFDEKVLLQLLKRGDENAFCMLYAHYSKKIFLNISLLVKSEEMALDLLQDVFLKVWQRREHIDEEKNFKAYLYTISGNLVKDFFRQVNKRDEMRKHYVEKGSHSHNPVEHLIDFKETSELLNKAMENLNETERSVFTLCRLEGMSYQDAANILGLSPSTVGNNLVKANTKIKAYLSGSALFWMLVINSL